ncbi:MAG: methionine--tRNA ligase [Deltaproteobacteria bacterium]|nr:methionine--tRNA ligase [Deltaproteobacteria bacterium]
MMRSFYVSTPIYYINDVPHLGSAYTTVAADVLCRYHALRGADAFFLTGTDEHGLKIQRAAEERAIAPQALANEVSRIFEETWPKLGCAPNDFIRTSSDRHKRGVQELWKRIAERGDIYLGHYEGLYCVGCEGYYTEKELEQPGNRCPLHKKPAETVKEESYFFRLSNYGERLLRFYDANPTFVEPEGRMNEVKSFVASGLQDLSVSRTTFDWGVPVPGDPRHVMYVWFDALSNYWTALQDPVKNAKFWPATVHLVGKDILRFHAVYWPAFLMAAGFSDEELPRKVLAHGFLTYGGHKMSKSLRNTVSPVALAEAVSPTVGVDVVRYCLMRSISFGNDGDFSIDDVLGRYGTDLGNTFGNLLHRIHPFAGETLAPANNGPLEAELREAARAAARASAEAFDACSPTRALEAIWVGLMAANAYIDKAAPWAARKQGDEARVAAIVTAMAEVLEAYTVMVSPVMPKVADMMRAQLGLAPLASSVGRDAWPFTLPTRPDGSRLVKGDPVFPRHDKDVAAALKQQFSPPPDGPKTMETTADSKPDTKPEPAAAPSTAPEAKVTITYDDFAKIDLRVGVVIAAERIPRKDRLLALKVDVGEAEPRSIIAGIALAYAPEEVVGKRIAVLCNLAPRDFGKGLVSHGMLMAASHGDVLKLVAVPDELPAGSPIK